MFLQHIPLSMKRLFLFVCILFAAPYLSAQTRSDSAQMYVQMIQEPKANFFEIQEAFNRYWTNHVHTKRDGWKQFKRWEYFWQSRVMDDGSFPDPSLLRKALDEKNAKKLSASRTKATKTQSAQANFTLMGPSSAIPTSGGCGRLTTVCFHPTNNNIIFVGTPAGGLWKTTNNGASWSSNTDQFATLGVSAIAIDASNPSTMYIGTGDRDASDSYGTGIYKSTDGGSSWTSTGFSNSIQSFVIVNRLLVHPSQGNILIAATTGGIYKSTDGGNSWSQKISASTKDMVFMPSFPSVIYATSGGTIYRSMNTGDSWSALSPGFSSGSVNRICLGVCDQNPRCLYALCSNASNSTFYGIYRSLDTGNTWANRASTPNILGGSSSGSDNTGQGWYDLAMAVNPGDSNDVFVGGVNTWRSTNGGTSWTCKTMWYTGTSLPYIHADQHEIAYKPGTSEMYVCDDGGLFKTTNSGTTWTDLSAGLQNMEFYRISNSAQSASKAMGGAQDNGTNYFNGSTWKEIYGGDGMDNAIDQSNDAVLYASSQYGNFGRSTNSGTNFSTITPSGQGGGGAWVTPITLDSGNNVYIAYRNVYMSTNQGSAWTTIGSNVTTSVATYIDVAKSNPNYIVVGNSSQLYRTTNGGTTWTSIKGTLPSNISRVVIHPLGPDTIVATMSSWSSGNKVFKSTNGGSSWTNISGSLPNVPVDCALYEGNTANGLYIGTDIGVYYRNNLMSDWVSFDDGLPNVRVNDLEMYTPTSKLRAGTYGRGMWQGDLYNDGPHAQMTASRLTICAGDTLTLHDVSTNSPTSRQWLLPGATPSTSTSANPVVSYATAGQYSVTLMVYNGFGSDTVVSTNYINVLSVPTASYSATKTTACTGDSIVLTGPASMASYHWSTNDTTQSIVLRNAGNYNIQLTVVAPNGCPATSASQSFTLYASPTTTISGDTIVCAGSDGSYHISATTPGSVYRWFKPRSSSTPSDSISSAYTVHWPNAGRDTIHLRETNVNGCSVDRLLPVIIGAIPSFTISGPVTTCVAKTQNYSCSALPSGATIEWFTPHNGSIVGANNNTSGVNINWNHSGADTVRATVTSSLGCTYSFGFPINILNVSAVQINGEQRVCQGSTHNYTVAFDSSVSYQWVVPNGSSIQSGAGTNTISVVWGAAGQDSIRCTLSSAAGCSATSSFGVSVVPLPSPSISGADAACVGSSQTYAVAQNAGNKYAWKRPRLGTTSDTASAAVHLNWLQSGVDTLVVVETTPEGCKNNKSYVVHVAAQLHPQVNASSGTTLCVGDTVHLAVANSYSSYSWQRNGQGVGSNEARLEVTEDGSYSVLVSSGNCSGSSDTVAVNFYSAPATPSLSQQGSTLHCEQSAVSYQWFVDNVLISGATDQDYSAVAAGNYCVELVDVNGCRSPKSCIDYVVGVSDDVVDESLVVLEPNPTHDVFRIKSTMSIESACTITVFDETGRLVYRTTMHSNQELNALRIDMRAFSVGVYNVQLQFDGRHTIHRALVHH